MMTQTAGQRGESDATGVMAGPERPSPFEVGPVLSTVIIIFFLGVMAAVALVLHRIWPYLQDEHARLRPWQAFLMWTGEIAALFWFARFCFVRGMLRIRPDPSLSQQSKRRPWLIAASVFLGSVLVDMTVSFATAYDEHRAQQRAVTTEAEVKTTRFPGLDGEHQLNMGRAAGRIIQQGTLVAESANALKTLINSLRAKVGERGTLVDDFAFSFYNCTMTGVTFDGTRQVDAEGRHYVDYTIEYRQALSSIA